MVPPMPGTPHPPWVLGLVGKRAQGCCRKLLLRGLCCNWGETQRFHHLLLSSVWGAWPRGAAGGGCGPGPLSLSHKCYYAKAAVGAVPGEKPWPKLGSAPGTALWAPPCPMEGGWAAGTDPGPGSSSLELHESMCWGGGGFGGEAESPLLQSPSAVGGSEHKAKAAPFAKAAGAGVLLALWVLQGGG